MLIDLENIKENIACVLTRIAYQFALGGPKLIPMNIRSYQLLISMVRKPQWHAENRHLGHNGIQRSDSVVFLQPKINSSFSWQLLYMMTELRDTL